MSEILVVDDEPGIRELMGEILQDEGYEVRMAENGGAARRALEEKMPDMVLLDIWMPDVDGVTLLKEWKTQGRLTIPVVMMSGHGTVHTAVEATRLGAFDYLEKPIALKQLLETVKKALDAKPARPTTTGDLSALGQGEAIRRLTQRLNLAVAAGLPIALIGEPGAGAQHAARYLTPPDGTFLSVDVPASLANQPAEILAQAKGGLVFVPDLGALNAMQQRGLVLLLGRRAEFGVRVVTTSEAPLTELLTENRISQELHDLFAHAVVDLPPLRERREDIIPMAQRLMEDACARLLVAPRAFAENALGVLTGHDWPGNLDELQLLAERLAMGGGDAPIEAAEIKAILGPGKKSANANGIDLMLHLPLKDARDQFEKAYLEAMLEECHWGMSRAAERAGLDRTNLYRKVKQLGIEAPEKK
jgi:two-component system, NtrC family, nitrogen regulation response regulator NtrX